ncbi:MAG: ParB/RepB/Spo0J family partition protein, partial [Betaproteobacteria bacterium]|nr:ParB/RepB/Spo0J family partition protein [Betaproteobacteria bacterium]
MAAPEQTEKRRPRFDFSTLSDPVSVQSARKWAAEAGQRTIVELSLDDVVEDPDNPRTSFKQEALQALASSIRTRGVMQPVLVREKNADGKHVIIQGARRYRGSRIAGKTTIPAIIIPNAELENFDDYSQVIENVQRENLNAEEMCAFIVKRLDKGDKKGVIAEKLGLRAQLISAYLVIKDLAENVLALFRAGKIDGIEPLYDLTRLQKKAPELAAQLIAEAEENPLGSITQPMIRSALKSAEEGAGSGNGGDPIGTQGQTGTGQAQPTEPKSSNAQSTQPAPAASESGQQVGEGLSSQSESAGREEEPSGEAAVGATSL